MLLAQLPRKKKKTSNPSSASAAPRLSPLSPAANRRQQSAATNRGQRAARRRGGGSTSGGDGGLAATCGVPERAGPRRGEVARGGGLIWHPSNQAVLSGLSPAGRRIRRELVCPPRRRSGHTAPIEKMCCVMCAYRRVHHQS